MSPTDDILVKATIRGIRRKTGTAPAQKTALVAKSISKNTALRGVLARIRPAGGSQAHAKAGWPAGGG